ncbi:alpha/beta fold hydrolase [Billgrantia endophytica]|uniref:Alpha/beta hydrolase n=1 Tax=Billgrantia endophytica TaxID=2033802 RepID=A0A2N7U916_9GAMM|nr:alpha/beta fold hydrolase [Halomonas endophytica]PMR76908.1 alpha/beta hydrolase [Halomonas endophytica]
MTSLVLLSGWGVDARIWQPLAPYWPQGLNVQTPDWPGYGAPADTLQPVPATPDDMAGLARQMASKLPTDAVWVGWSLGGLLASSLLAYLPPPRALVMLGMGPRFCATDGVTDTELATFRRTFERNPDATWRHFLRWQLQGEPDSRTAYRRLLDLVGHKPSASCATLAAGLDLLARLDARHILATPPCPIHQVVGRNDPLLSGSIRQAADHILGDTGHCPMLTRPDRLARHLVAVLSRVDHATPLAMTLPP